MKLDLDLQRAGVAHKAMSFHLFPVQLDGDSRPHVGIRRAQDPCSLRIRWSYRFDDNAKQYLANLPATSSDRDALVIDKGKNLPLLIE